MIAENEGGRGKDLARVYETNVSKDASPKKLLNFELKVFTKMYLLTHLIVDMKIYLQIKYWQNKDDSPIYINIVLEMMWSRTIVIFFYRGRETVHDMGKVLLRDINTI